MRLRGTVCLLMFLTSVVIVEGQNEGITIGVIADCQYCSDPGSGVRKYAKSEKKLSECVHHFNSLELSYVIHLGDFIDRDFESFGVVKPIFDSLEAPSYHVLGNHDFSVADKYKGAVPALLNIPSRYNFFDLRDWRFIILDGNDLSFHAYPEGSEKFNLSKEYYDSRDLDAPKWNGAIGDEQIHWLRDRLEEAEKMGQHVMLYCHFPVFPNNIHNLWNAENLVDLLSQYDCVKAYVNGHNHEGNYSAYHDIHFLTLKGMVDTELTSYAIFKLSADTIEVKGFGRETDRLLKIR
ncbi:MAG: metallophosphoesterase [Saprospiraceae bacterium]|nr:metallophosphoesterase [Saprospiraceae bacterium]